MSTTLTGLSAAQLNTIEGATASVTNLDGSPCARDEHGMVIPGPSLTGDGSGVALPPPGEGPHECAMGVSDAGTPCAGDDISTGYAEDLAPLADDAGFALDDPVPFTIPRADVVQQARAALGCIALAAEELGHALTHESALEDERPLVAARCTLAMIGTPNPLGKEGAVHSASSAEKVVESHPEFMAHRQAQRTAVVGVQRAKGRYAAACLRARLMVAVVERDLPTGG